MFRKWLENSVQSGMFEGACLAYFKAQEEPCFECVGTFPDLNGNAQNLTINSLFDCASVTKSIPTGILALQALETAHWNLDQKVCDLIPELSMKHANEIQIKHLLTHTLDYRISMSSLKDLPPNEIWQRIFQHEFEYAPGQSYLYCNASSMLLGLCLERSFGQSLEELAQSKIFDILGLKRTGFFSNGHSFDMNEFVPTEICPWRSREIRATVHDESSYALLPQNLGSAGLFSCVEDLSLVVQDLLSQNSKLLGPSAQALMGQNAIDHLGLSVGYGFELNSVKWMSNKWPKLLGKTGFTGSCIAFDPIERVGMVLLSNWTWPKRKSSPQAIFDFRKMGTELLWDWAHQ